MRKRSNKIFDFSKELTASLYGSQSSSKASQSIRDQDLFPEIKVEISQSTSLWLTLGVLHPEGWIHMSWDFVLTCLLAHQSYYVPYQLCFNVPIDEETLKLDILVSAVFMADILISFNTGVLEKGSLVMSRNKIALIYARFWLWLDIIAGFPYDWVINGDPMTVNKNESSQASKVPRLFRIAKLLRVFRMLRLLRLARLRSLMMKIEGLLSDSFIVMVFLLLKLLLVVFFIAHLTACFWFYISELESIDFPITWISTYEIYSKRALNYNDFYIASLYWAFTTMTTVGYGDFVPYTSMERIYAIMCMIVACGLFAYIVGSIGSIVTKQSERNNEHIETILNTNSYMRRHNLPRELQFRVRRYLDYKWDTEDTHYFDEESVMSMFSEPLRNEISAFMHSSIIRSCPSILGFSESFVQQLSKTFRSEIFAPGDSIFNEGELSFHLYFVQNGTVDVYHRGTNSTFRELSKGAFFGEIGFFTGHTRWASVRCLLFTNLLALSVDNLKDLARKNPDAEDYLEGIRERCKDNNYTTLEVVCYICGQKGHVALMCGHAILNLNHDVVKRKWLHSKIFRKSIKVNPYFGDPPNFKRPAKKYIKAVGNGRYASIKQLISDNYKPRPSLISSIKGYNSTQGISPQSKASPSVSSVFDSPGKLRHPNYSIIYKDSDSDDEVPAYFPALKPKNFSSYIQPDIEDTLDQSHIIQPRAYNTPNSPMSAESDDSMLYL